MDYNSPIYREKYLKYKKKYLELKAMEEENQLGGGALDSFKNMFKTPDYAANTNLMSVTFTNDKKKAMDNNDKLLKDIKQKKLVQKQMRATLAEGYMTKDMAVGPVKKAIKDNKDASTSADDLLKAIYTANLKVGDQTFDNVQSYVDAETKLKLGEIHKGLIDQVGNEKSKTENTLVENQEMSVTITQIKNLETQLDVEKSCKEMGVELEKCDATKIELVKKLVTIIKKIDESKEAKEKSANTYINSKNMAQKSMDELATELAKLNSGSVTAPVKDEDLLKMINDNDTFLREEVVKALALTSNKPEDVSFQKTDDKVGGIQPSLLQAIGKLENVTEQLKQLSDLETLLLESTAKGQTTTPPGSPKANTSEEGKKEAEKKEAEKKEAENTTAPVPAPAPAPTSQ